MLVLCFIVVLWILENNKLSFDRTHLLNIGVEKRIRKAKQNHEICKEAATDALRDLGLDDYNL